MAKRQRINPAWQRKQLERLDVDHSNFEVTLNMNAATQWLIMELDRRNISYRVVQLGAGVKKITTQTDICPKCHGTGRC